MLAVLMLAPGLGITSAPIAAEGPGLARLEPQTGLYIGVVLGRETSRGKHIKELGFKPAVVGKFFAMQGNLSENGELRSFLLECRRHGAIALLTLMPEDGLDKVDERRCHELAELCAREEKAGARGIMLRFAHEMNGDWYRWGMQPGLYKRKFRMLSAVIHRTTTRTAMVWAPTECRGYPFKRHPYSLELDTDRDGKITAADDPYMPFFPGDDSVDWVGLTFYHWGVK